MTEIFSTVLNMSLTASVVIGVALLLRLLLSDAPKGYSYALWSVVLFRLLCPVSVESGLSILPDGLGYRPGEQAMEIYEAMEPGELPTAAYHAVGDVLNGGLGTVTVKVEPGHGAGEGSGYGSLMHPEVWFLVFARLWPTGAALLAGYSLWSLFCLRRRLSAAVLLRDNIYRAEGIGTPFVLGVVRPKIYLPAGILEAEMPYIIRHEEYHIRRGDHIIKILAFAALCIHWFNPLVWLAFVLAGKDMEMSCDEAVLKQMGGDIRADYSQSLLALATGRRRFAATPLAFGEGDPKGRIKNVLKWKKPKVWVSALALSICIVGICACAVDPKTPEVPPVQVPTQLPEVIVEQETPTEAEVENTTLPTTTPAEPKSEDTPELPKEIGKYTGIVSRTYELHHAILDHHRSPYSNQYFCCANYIVLANEAGTRVHPVTGNDLNTMTYYLWVLYQEYRFTEDGIVDEGGAHIPTVITLTENPDGSWSVINYWEPRDGSYYVEDIRAVFPGDSVNDALDSQKYIHTLKRDCYEQAVSYANVKADVTMDVDVVISNLLDNICSSPLESSNPKDYVADHPIEYRELLYYGGYTRDYCERYLYGLGVEDGGPAEISLRERVMEMLLGELNL